MEKIELRRMRKSYGKEPAVRHLDLNIEPGSFLTILGPSGCGKTTTLRTIAGLEEPDAGEIQLGDRIVFSRDQGIIVPPEHRKLGLIFQSYALWPHMTVERNITLALKEQKLSTSEVSSRLENALQKVQLTAFRNRYPSELSGGQQQRVAVARLIALRSQFLLMDEPLSNLDAKLRTEMRTELKQLHRDLEATTVYVTHDQIEALTLSDMVVVMNDGLVMQQATPYDIYHHPSNLFVAEFIGDPRINRFSGNVINEGGVMALDCGDIKFTLPPELTPKTNTLIATVRPESIRISEVADKGWERVTLDSVQPTGASTILQVRSKNNTAMTLLQPGFMRMQVGDHLWVDLDSTAIDFFDPESEQNLIS
jgi:multiple sugar transport system ATP-binding protein